MKDDPFQMDSIKTKEVPEYDPDADFM